MQKLEVKAGDLIELGAHRLVCGDASKAEHLRILFVGNEKADMICADAPYGVGYVEGKEELKQKFKPIANDGIIQDYYSFSKSWLDPIKQSLSLKSMELFLIILIIKLNNMKNGRKKAGTSKPKQKKQAGVENPEVKKRADSEHNLALIYAKYLEIAMREMRWPKLQEIADETNLSVTTVFNHMNDNRSDFEQLKTKYSIFTEMALLKLGINAAKGTNEKWVELFFKVMHGVGDKKQIDLTSGGKRIGGMDVTKLSDDELLSLRAMKQKLDGQ